MWRKFEPFRKVSSGGSQLLLADAMVWRRGVAVAIFGKPDKWDDRPTNTSND